MVGVILRSSNSLTRMERGLVRFPPTGMCMSASLEKAQTGLLGFTSNGFEL